MTEVGSLQIGGSIDTSNIERGLTRVETGFKNVEAVGKGVNSDFVRMNQQAKSLGSNLTKIGIVGGGAMIALAKGAPAVAGSMAKIRVTMGKLSRTLGEALSPAFEVAAKGLEKLSNWASGNPDVFGAVVTSIVGLGIATAAIKIGGWIYGAWAAFFGLLKGMVLWEGWAILAAKISSVAGKAAAIISGGGVAAGVAGGLAVGGMVAGIAAGPLINTYQREITGESGFLDKWLTDVNRWNFQRNILESDRKTLALQMEYTL